MVSSFLQAYLPLAKLHQQAVQQEVDNEMAQQQADALNQYRQGELDYRKQQDITRNKQIDEQTAHNMATEQANAEKLRSQELRNQTTNWRQAFGNALKDPNATTFRDVLARASFAMPGYTPSQEDLQNAASLAGVQMNAPAPSPTPATPGPSEQPQGATPTPGQVGQVGGQPIPMLSQQAPQPQSWMDQPLPMNEERRNAMQSLIVQRQAHAALQQQQADKLQRMAGLDQEIQQANLDHIKATTELMHQRSSAMQSNTQFDQWYKTGMLNARQAANDIAATRNTIYQQAINNVQSRSDRSAAIQQLAGQRAFLTKQYQGAESEIKTLSALIDKNDQKARLAAEYVQSASQTGQGDPAQVQAAQAQYLALTGTLRQQRKQLQQLQAERDNTQGLISQTLGQPVSPNGTFQQPPNFVPQGKTPGVLTTKPVPGSGQPVMGTTGAQGNPPSNLKMMTPQLREAYIRRTNGDIAKAKALAAKEGYDVR